MMSLKGGHLRRIGQSTIKKGDMVLVLCVIMAAFFMHLIAAGQSEGERVLVTVDGQTSEYSLRTDRTISLKNGDSVCNSIVIKGGQVYMALADCPDQICVHHRAISQNRESIICLPNKVIVEVESSQSNDIDN